jgi:hypothetical protein
LRIEVGTGGGEVGGDRRGSGAAAGEEWRLRTGCGRGPSLSSRALMRMDVGLAAVGRGVSCPDFSCAGAGSAGGEPTTVVVDDSEVDESEEAVASVGCEAE